ncbi:hypothetical protein [Paraburkholderia caribensis]|uniref:hypothetical protein n=1 Tax=Paraburkholderia caribensis TaxID=75105 RepID=UPI0011DFF7F7|nr:hypothetical protein [Paraburkholderia caribensis]
MQQDRWEQVYRIICRSNEEVRDVHRVRAVCGAASYSLPALLRFSVAINADLSTIDLHDAISAVTARIAVLAGIRPCLLPRLA